MFFRGLIQSQTPISTSADVYQIKNKKEECVYRAVYLLISCVTEQSDGGESNSINGPQASSFCHLRNLQRAPADYRGKVLVDISFTVQKEKEGWGAGVGAVV